MKLRGGRYFAGVLAGGGRFDRFHPKQFANAIAKLLLAVARDHFNIANAGPPQRFLLDRVAGGCSALVVPLALNLDGEGGPAAAIDDKDIDTLGIDGSKRIGTRRLQNFAKTRLCESTMSHPRRGHLALDNPEHFVLGPVHDPALLKCSLHDGVQLHADIGQIQSSDAVAGGL